MVFKYFCCFIFTQNNSTIETTYSFFFELEAEAEFIHLLPSFSHMYKATSEHLPGVLVGFYEYQELAFSKCGTTMLVFRVLLVLIKRSCSDGYIYCYLSIRVRSYV